MTNQQAYDLSEQLSRTEMLLGSHAMQNLAAARVAVFGIGGVGGYTVEALARSGIGALDLIDSDRVSLSNLNRQIIATRETIGMLKVEAARERIAQINPEIKVTCHPVFFLPENAADFDFAAYDYVVDAVDTVTAKIALIIQAKQAGTPVISCMGAGNKLDASRFEVADIYQTSVCPLAKVMRRELKKRGVDTLNVVYSREEAQKNTTPPDAETGKRPPASCAFVPAVAGLIIAGEVIKGIAAK